MHDVVALVEPSKNYLQTVGVAASPKTLFELTEKLGGAGVTRVCALGSMTAPQAGWHHDGRCNLSDLVSFTDLDSSALSAAKVFAPYVD